MTIELTKIIKKHWAGNYSQGVAFWVILVGGLALIKTTAEFLSLFNLIQNPVVSTRIWLPVFAATICAVLPWLFIGTTRAVLSDFRHMNGGQQSLMLLGGIALVGFFTFKDVLFALPYMQNMATIALKSEPKTLSIQSPPGESKLIKLDGFLNYGAYAEVKAALLNAKEIDTVELNIDGGRLYEARQIAGILAENQINTVVNQQCYGVCTLVLVAGKDRIADRNADIRFHREKGYNNGYRSDWLIERERKKDQLYYKKRGVRESFTYVIFYKQNNNEYYEPELNVLLQNGVLTRIVQ